MNRCTFLKYMQSIPILFLKALRPHQWSKNLLLFAPMALAHEIGTIGKYQALCLAFVSLCLVSSAVYLINDIFDVKADRLHPVKKQRPIASGALSTRAGIVGAGILLCAGFGTAFGFMELRFSIMLLAYALLTVIYSVALKRFLLVDVIVLSFFYTLRLLLGGLAGDVLLTPWFLAFSWFFFLSLAFVKRFVELKTCAAAEGPKHYGRGYVADDSQMLQIAGIASGLLSVLVFLLYIASSDQAKALYKNPQWLWLVAPVLVYWIMRTWLLAQRDRIDCDPVTFALKDPPSWLSLMAAAGLLVLATAGCR